MKVPTDYAGKKVRCKGCQEPLRVPASKPKSEPVAAASASGLAVGGGSSGDSRFGSSSSSSISSISLAELAEMEARAPVGVVQHDAVNFPEGKQPCPSCGSPCANEARLCVQCGYQFDGGTKLRTKKASDKLAAKVSGGSFPGLSFSSEPAWGTVISGVICLGIAVAAVVMDFNPGEDPRGWFQHILSASYAIGGKWIAGGLLGISGLAVVWWGLQGDSDSD